MHADQSKEVSQASKVAVNFGMNSECKSRPHMIHRAPSVFTPQHRSGLHHVIQICIAAHNLAWAAPLRAGPAGQLQLHCRMLSRGQ